MKAIFYIYILFIVTQAYSQSLVYENLHVVDDAFDSEIPQDQALLIFQTDLELEFDSSMEFLKPAKFENGFYFLFVTQRTAVISVISHYLNSSFNLGFGQMTGPSGLQPGEVKYYRVFKKNKLISYDITSEERQTSSDNQMRYEREALLIINKDPIDLKLEFESNAEITEIRKEPSRYLLYIKPKDQFITITHKESNAQNLIELNNIQTKDVRYFFVSLPHSLRNLERKTMDFTLETGSYRIETNPPGALIQLAGSSAFNREKNRTPHTISGERAGTNIITLTLDDYETLIDTIQIGSDHVNFSSYELKPTFSLVNFNINPPPPFSHIYVDGNALDGVKNNKKVKVGLGDIRVRITAEHFYEENFIISTAAGRELPVSVSLKPKMGKVTFYNDINSLGAQVYVQNDKFMIEKTKLGKLTNENSFELQEGQYKATLTKEGFGDKVYDLSIRHNETTSLQTTMREGKLFTISSNPQGAELFINNTMVGFTPYTSAMAFDNYSIKLVNNSRIKETTINLTNQSSNIQDFDVHETYGVFVDDRDGKEYNWIKIGEQVWMAENLAFRPESFGRRHRSNNDLKYYPPGDKEHNVTKYGYLYDYNSALSICPAGWHLPDLEQWQALTSFLSELEIDGNWQIGSGVSDHGLNFQVSAGYRTQLGAREGRFDYLNRNSYYWVKYPDKGVWITLGFTNDSQRKLNKVNYSYHYDGYLYISVRCVKE